MAYCNQDDIGERLDQDTLIQLTDDTDTGAVDTSKVARAIADADAEINGYVARRYTVPLSPVPDLVRMLSVELAIYHLYSRRQGASEEWCERHKHNLATLTGISRGDVILDQDDPAAPASSPAEFLSQPRVFSRDTLEDF